MTLLQALLSFAVIAGLLTIVPGLDTALVLRSTVSRSRAHGFSAALGIQAGTLIWGAAAATGAAALLAASQTAYRLLTLAGAAYMIFLGVSMIRQTLGRNPSDSLVDVQIPATKRTHTLGRSFATGLGTNLMNPKVGVFYIAAIPQFVPEGPSPLLMGLLLAAVHCAIGLTWLSIIILGADLLGSKLRNSHALRWIDRLTGGVLIVFGTRLALTPRA